MKASHFIISIAFLLSCNKKEQQDINPGRSNQSSNCIGNAFVKGINSSCKESPTLINVSGNFFDQLLFGFTDPFEYWAYNLPDSANANGQQLEIVFKAKRKESWMTCSPEQETLPNQIDIVKATPVLEFDELEVLEFNPQCPDLVLVKVHPFYNGNNLMDRALCGNLPGSLKIVGKKITCWKRFAGRNEIKICEPRSNLRQIIVTEPQPR